MVQAHLKEFIAIVRAGTEDLGRAIGGLLAQAGDEVFLLVGEIIKP